MRIQDLARGGAGVGRDEAGRVIFVPFTAPGDLVQVEIVEEQKNYAQGRLLEVIESSPVRQVPPCSAFMRCGGCQWQHLPYELQWKTKVAGARHAIKRTQVAFEGEWEEFPAERIWEYRNRVQARGFGGELGFFAEGTKSLVPVDRCEIARPEINAQWARIRAAGAKKPAPFKVEIEVLEDGHVREAWNARHAALGFRQIHDEQNEKLRSWVASVLPPGRVLYDLYGGSGNLSWALREQMLEVHCVDFGAPAERSIGTFRFHRGDVARWISHFEPQTAANDTLAVLDPPREGLGSDFTTIADGLERLRVSQFVAVGCDADAWARDLSRFQRRGWKVTKAAVFDLFPQTPHVESVAMLERGRSRE